VYTSVASFQNFSRTESIQDIPTQPCPCLTAATTPHLTGISNFYNIPIFFKQSTKMTSPPTIQPKFLSRGDELAVVAVGFSGGQVRSLPLPCSSLPFIGAHETSVQTRSRRRTLGAHLLRPLGPTHRRPRLHSTPRQHRPLLRVHHPRSRPRLPQHEACARRQRRDAPAQPAGLRARQGGAMRPHPRRRPQHRHRHDRGHGAGHPRTARWEGDGCHLGGCARRYQHAGDER